MPLSFQSRRFELWPDANWTQLSSAHTSPEYGKDPFSRTIPELLQVGIINLDKPPHPTSHEIVAHVKHLLEIPKAGHSGTLDPQVTGILPIALQQGTKVLEALLSSPKGYVVLMKLHEPTSEDRIREVIAEFTTTIYQRPPLKSSVRKRLRKRTIYETTVLDIVDTNVLFTVYCQSGTYIRKLCTDIGEALGTGAHMAELRRIKTGPFIEDETLVTLQDLVEAIYLYKEHQLEAPLRSVILPIEAAVRHLPKIVVHDSAVDALCHGARLSLSGVVKHSIPSDYQGKVAIMTLKKELVALGDLLLPVSQWDTNHASSLFVAAPNKVVMKRGTYPRSW